MTRAREKKARYCNVHDGSCLHWISLLTCSNSYWHDSVAAFPVITASGTKIFRSFKQKAVNTRKSCHVNNILIYTMDINIYIIPKLRRRSIAKIVNKRIPVKLVFVISRSECALFYCKFVNRIQLVVIYRVKQHWFFFAFVKNEKFARLYFISSNY